MLDDEQIGHTSYGILFSIALPDLSNRTYDNGYGATVSLDVRPYRSRCSSMIRRSISALPMPIS